MGELTALEVALDLMAEAELDPQTPIVLVTDSQYAIGVLVKGWKAKKNTELIVGLRAKLQAWPTARLKWVKGHAGEPGNEFADYLTNAAMDGVSGGGDGVAEQRFRESPIKVHPA